MQLTQRECRELRELLLEDELFALTPPSSLSPLLEILESTSLTTPVASDPMSPSLSDLRPKSTVYPSLNLNKSIQLFLKLTTNELQQLPIHRTNSANLSPALSSAPADLRGYTHLTIKEADKGGRVVVMDNDEYNSMCMDLLNNSKWYCPISFLQIDSFTIDFYRLKSIRLWTTAL